MAGTNRGQKSRHAVGIFSLPANLQRGVQSLLDADVEREDLCLAGQQAIIERACEDGEIGENPNLLTKLVEDTVLVTGDGKVFPLRVSTGGIAERLASGAYGSEMQDGEWLERWLIPRHAHALENHLVAGRYLLWVRIRDADDEKRVCTILLRHSDFPVQVHDLAI